MRSASVLRASMVALEPKEVLGIGIGEADEAVRDRP